MQVVNGNNDLGNEVLGRNLINANTLGNVLRKVTVGTVICNKIEILVRLEN
jgi:hypothetical protein